VKDLLDLVQLDWLADRYPSHYRRQRQRIALARALAIEPRSAAGRAVRRAGCQGAQELRRWLRQLHDEIRVTSLFVTHDQENAGSRQSRCRLDRARSSRSLAGESTTIRQSVRSRLHRRIYRLPVQVSDGKVRLNDKVLNLDPRDAVSGPSKLFIRRHDVAIVANGSGVFEGDVKHVRAFGPTSAPISSCITEPRKR